MFFLCMCQIQYIWKLGQGLVDYALHSAGGKVLQHSQLAPYDKSWPSWRRLSSALPGAAPAVHPDADKVNSSGHCHLSILCRGRYSDCMCWTVEVRGSDDVLAIPFVCYKSLCLCVRP